MESKLDTPEHVLPNQQVPDVDSSVPDSVDPHTIVKKKRVHVMTPARQAAFEKACAVRKLKLAERRQQKIDNPVTPSTTPGNGRRSRKTVVPPQESK